LRRRLRDRVRVKTTAGFIERGELKPATVHQELRVQRRMLNVAVRKKLVPRILVRGWSSRSQSKACFARTI
jgi:hypothetical protein